MEGKTMHLELNEETGLLSLSSTTSEEADQIDRIATVIGKNGKLKYDGRGGAGHHTPFNERMELYFKLGDERIVMTASSDEDEPLLRGLRDGIFFGGNGCVYVMDVQDCKRTGKKLLNIYVVNCQHCKAPLVQRIDTEWKTCGACSAKCEHQYRTGMMHGGTAGKLGEGMFCEKCGRAKPDEDVRVIIPLESGHVSHILNLSNLNSES